MQWSALPLLALLVWAYAARAEPGTATYWIDALRFSPEDSLSIASAVARMVEDKNVAAARRRDEADLLIRLRLGPARGTSQGSETSSSAGREPDEAQIETEAAVSTAIAAVELSLVDVVEGATLLERSLRCRMPLAEGARVSDPMLRASLSDVAAGMGTWGASRPEAARAETFGVSADERGTLPPAELAVRLYDEGIRASRRGYHEAALDLLAEAQPLFKQSGRRDEEGLAWERLAVLMASTGREIERALPYAKQAVKIARESKDSGAEARGLVTLGFLEAQSGRYAEALDALQSSQRKANGEKAVLTEATAFAGLAGVTAARGKFDSARELQKQALGLAVAAGNPGAEGRIRLAMALVESHLDERDRGRTLSELVEVRRLAEEAGDLALQKDALFVQAHVRLSTTDLEHLREGELDAIRALKLARRLGDRLGEAAGLALLGAFSHKLMRPALAAEYLAEALAMARENGYPEIAVDVLQLLGEMAPNGERALALLEDALALRRKAGDSRGEIKTLSDMCRLHAGLGQLERAEERHREAVSLLGRYAQARSADPFVEDVRESFVVTIKSLLTTRTELPFLEGYLEIRNLVVAPATPEAP
jgi:tetratricopeptide (TPR) repeat protein